MELYNPAIGQKVMSSYSTYDLKRMNGLHLMGGIAIGVATYFFLEPMANLVQQLPLIGGMSPAATGAMSVGLLYMGVSIAEDMSGINYIN